MIANIVTVLGISLKEVVLIVLAPSLAGAVVLPLVVGLAILVDACHPKGSLWRLSIQGRRFAHTYTPAAADRRIVGRLEEAALLT